MLLYVLVIALVLNKLNPYMEKPMRLPSLAYMCLISFMSLSALLLTVNRFSVYSMLLYVGSLLFVFSDTILSFQIFRHRSDGGYLRVMLSYLAAQTAIVVGLAQLGGM